MRGYLRLYQTAIDPADVEEARRLFADDVRAAFDETDGCLAVELLFSGEKNAGGLMEAAVMSRWESLEAMERAMSSRPVNEGIVRFRQLFRQEPVAKVFETAE